MILFEEMEKCFPELEKHFQEQIDRRGKDKREDTAIEDTYIFLTRLLRAEFLYDGSRLHELFMQAGETSIHRMANIVLQWFCYYQKLNQKDTGAVQR